MTYPLGKDLGKVLAILHCILTFACSEIPQLMAWQTWPCFERTKMLKMLLMWH